MHRQSVIRRGCLQMKRLSTLLTRRTGRHGNQVRPDISSECVVKGKALPADKFHALDGALEQFVPFRHLRRQWVRR